MTRVLRTVAALTAPANTPTPLPTPPSAPSAAGTSHQPAAFPIIGGYGTNYAGYGGQNTAYALLSIFTPPPPRDATITAAPDHHDISR